MGFISFVINWFLIMRTEVLWLKNVGSSILDLSIALFRIARFKECNKFELFLTYLAVLFYIIV